MANPEVLNAVGANYIDMMIVLKSVDVIKMMSRK